MRTVALLSFTRAIRGINKLALPSLAGFSLYPRSPAYLPIPYAYYQINIQRNFQCSRRNFLILKTGFDREFDPLSGALLDMEKDYWNRGAKLINVHTYFAEIQ